MQDFMIVINLDEGVSHALARRLRAEGVYCRIMPAKTSADEVLRSGAQGIILAASSTGRPIEVPGMTDYMQIGLPMLCLSDAALTLCTAIGGSLTETEGGFVTAVFDSEDDLFTGIESGERYLPDLCTMAIDEEQSIACVTADESVIGLRVRQRNVYGLTFPLERNDPSTIQLLINFCCSKCNCTRWWSERTFIEDAKTAILEAAGESDALCALSGGVDSGVSALLGNLALGQRLHCLFVDTGLLRENEAEEVMEVYQNQLGLSVRRVDARAEFMLALRDIVDSSEKERIIRRLLKDILLREAKAIPGVGLLLRGTNYADAPVPETMLSQPEGLQILEPVRELFKDEIRHVGELLGLPQAMTNRQPFPGSGLANRIMAAVTAERLAILREADAIFRNEIESAGLHRRLWQYFAALALSPLQGGGLMIILRAVQAMEGGSGMPARLPSDLLERVTEEVMHQCPDVQRVFYDCTPSKTYAKLAGK